MVDHRWNSARRSRSAFIRNEISTTFWTSLTTFPVQEIIKTAFEHGINFIDVAEGYADGNSEREL
jgi:aryl-alcohol dehydrogenase-like predicted oxidoreductase